MSTIPKHLSVSEVTMWLSPHIFASTEWLDDWKIVYGHTLKGEVCKLEGDVEGIDP
jgi:hypothetical protein